jgi:tripartite-type tricarboxylate transporter receptor subunit TctC
VLVKNLPYDPLKDFTAVAPLTSQPYVLVSGTSSGITTVRELIAAAKAKPGGLKFGSTGIGTSSHLGLVEFNLQADIKAIHVPPRPCDAIGDLIANAVAGSTTYMMAAISLALADIRAGKLHALGVTTQKRSSLLPDVPTIAEAGVPGFDYAIWYGVWVPAGTPAQVVDKLARDIARALAAPDVRDRLAEHGADPMSMTQREGDLSEENCKVVSDRPPPGFADQPGVGSKHSDGGRKQVSLTQTLLQRRRIRSAAMIPILCQSVLGQLPFPSRLSFRLL